MPKTITPVYKINLIDTTVWGIFKNSIPMMISALSSHLMLVLDQLVLARYSTDAMAGASSAFLWSSIIQCMALSTTAIAGVFAGHYNGAKKYSMAGRPVWQMIYFSLMIFAISTPIGLICGKYCIPKSLQVDGIPYFRYIMTFSPLTGIIYSLSSFFVAIGRGLIVTIAATVSNVFNLILGIVFVFGYFGITWFEGSVGAALGTILAWIINIGILSFFFLKKGVRTQYRTTNCKLSLKLMKKCLKLGLPGGIGHIFEMLAWSILYYMLATVSTNFAMIQAMAFSVNIFLSFIASGLEKGMMAMTSNLLGAKNKSKIKPLLKGGIIIQLHVIMLLFIVFYFFPEIITSQFIRFDASEETMTLAFFILKLVWLFYVFDSILWVIAGVIEAGGDINYTMGSIASCLWVFVAIPAIFLYKYNCLNLEKVWYLLIMAAMMMVILLYTRYRSGKWIKIKV